MIIISYDTYIINGFLLKSEHMSEKKSVKKKANDLIAAVLILENYLNILNKNN